MTQFIILSIIAILISWFVMRQVTKPVIFQLWLNDDYFQKGDILKSYQSVEIIIVAKGVKIGNARRYKAIIVKTKKIK